MTKHYRVTRAGMYSGSQRNVGDVIDMDEADARTGLDTGGLTVEDGAKGPPDPHDVAAQDKADPRYKGAPDKGTFGQGMHRGESDTTPPPNPQTTRSKK